MDQDIPNIKRLIEVGENPFQFINKLESILQGWDQSKGKTIYLFKTDSGKWGYYDKTTSQVIEITSWNGKAAFVGDHYVKMALYHRIRIKFMQPIKFSAWDESARKEYPSETQEAITLVTDNAYKQIVEQLNGRAATSLLKFHFVTKKIGQRTSTYVDKVLWVS